jgi:hypothetical protein
MHSEKPALGLATPDPMMSRAEGSWRHRRRQWPRPLGEERRRRQHLDTARDRARRNDAEWARWEMEHGAARCWMGALPRGSLGRADGAVSHDERSEELEISVGCRSVDGLDRGENVDEPVGPVAVLERARSRGSNFYKIPNVCSLALPVANESSHLLEKQVSDNLCLLIGETRDT